ncbi:DinB family protein [Geobacillus sp. C56-T2]|uniref:DinB family protein n=1 Tax=Geobacillus sp. C56-T2 TaxID=600773 RepID=UPI00119E0176|nr:DinB family protein [Geobacillus sp. C56-T2]NNV07267.1 hypothetical protein [Geobacillus sp. MMMUD3]TWG29217.1 putative damage-inducible protein DinB [Geobacillus sp. C56-T2]
MPRAQKWVNYFLSHRHVTLELINKIDEAHYEYKPTPTSMTAKQLATHMLFSFYNFANAAKHGDPSLFRQKIEEPETNLAKLAETYTEKTRQLIESMSDDDFNRTLDFTSIFGIHIPATQLLQMAMDHEIHHKGQLFVYVRAMGHTDLPLFVKRG